MLPNYRVPQRSVPGLEVQHLGELLWCFSVQGGECSGVSSRGLAAAGFQGSRLKDAAVKP